MKRRILVADDEASIREFVVINLEHSNYEVVQAADGLEAWEAYLASEEEFDLALLDIMMPEMDGLELCRRIREKSSHTGIIFLTALTQEMDKVKGLLSGADDYITKPFSPSELMARVESVMRRVAQHNYKNTGTGADAEPSILASGDFRLDPRNRTLRRGSERIELTNIELQMMEYFLSNKDRILSRKDILLTIWGNDGVNELKIVDVNIRRLRIKIEADPSNPKRIVTIWGLGYKWVDRVE
ncbi:MAG: response regulator transcription factor [Oscillospiraceae bacterium]|jgi:DNA-binding response OmpR family regulator|nr:response regulator transcription factor [Oscillospiraceae bacterium]